MKKERKNYCLPFLSEKDGLCRMTQGRALSFFNEILVWGSAFLFNEKNA
jgi:hypothetical protein